MAGKTFSGIGVEELLKQNPPLDPEDAVSESEDVRGAYAGPTVAKTFSGLGVDELLGRNPPLRPEDAAPESEDVRGVYSGPTVVDDDKVAEGLERLKSLDLSPGKEPGQGQGKETSGAPSGEVFELVTDSSSSEPTRIGTPNQRSTAVGRSAVVGIPGQQLVVHGESLRGTMFGHSIHRPDVPPVEAEDLSPSGPMYVPPSQVRPVTTQMVPYQPQQHRDAPEAPAWQGQPVQPFPRRDIYSPQEDADQGASTIPPLSRRMVVRTVAFGLALFVLGGGAYAFMRYRADTDEGSTTLPPPAAANLPAPSAAPPTTPRAEPPAPLAPPRPTPPALAPSELRPLGPSVGTAASARTAAVEPGSVPPRPSPAAAKPAAARPPKPEAPPPAPELVEPASEAAESAAAHRRAARAERRRAAAEAAVPAPAPAVAPAPPKPSGRKKTPLEEDPDATLPPSTIE